MLPARLAPIVLGSATLVVIALVDYHTGPEIGISLFYLLPVVVAALLGDRVSGPLVAILAAVTWYFADVSETPTYSSSWAPIWNSFTRLVYFVTAVVLVREYRAKRALARALAVSERKYRSVFENAAVGVARVSPDGQWLEMNDRLSELLGYSSQELQRLTYQDVTHAEDLVAGVRQVKRLAQREISRFEMDTRYIRKDGSPIWVHLTGSSVRSDEGKLSYFVAVVEDISPRKEAEEALQHLNLELESRVLERTSELLSLNRELETFNHSIAHDLRTPLRGIDGFSHVLLEEYGDTLDEKGRQYLQRVTSSASRMGELIDALLTLSQLARGELQPSRVDMSAIANEVAAALRQREPRRRADIQVAAKLVSMGDPELLETLLTNLLENAWKFTRNTVKARIGVGCERKRGEFVFFVRDNGAGFDPEYSRKLFMPFQRLHSPGEFEGHGVGLATVKRIVMRHGGKIWAEGKVGQGATFFFTLPGPDPREAPIPQRRPADSNNSPSGLKLSE
ncbi:MAG: PAS domain S-box protein [Trueperaceae bacterium]